MGTPHHSRNAPLPGQLVFDPDVFGPGYPKEWYWPWHVGAPTPYVMAKATSERVVGTYYTPRKVIWEDWFVDAEKKSEVLRRRRVRR